jgi:hypothetical protein
MCPVVRGIVGSGVAVTVVGAVLVADRFSDRNTVAPFVGLTLVIVGAVMVGVAAMLAWVKQYGRESTKSFDAGYELGREEAHKESVRRQLSIVPLSVACEHCGEVTPVRGAGRVA